MGVDHITGKVTTWSISIIKYKKNYVQCYVTNISAPGKQHFVVKIQLSLDSEREPIRGERMVIFDQNKTFSFLLEKKFNEAVHPKLEKMIMEQGAEGLRGFFHAIVPPSPASAGNREVNSKSLVKIEINIENILPREAW